MTRRRASSLRFLKAARAEAVWPLRPREVESLFQSSFRAAERWGLGISISRLLREVNVLDAGQRGRGYILRLPSWKAQWQDDVN